MDIYIYTYICIYIYIYTIEGMTWIEHVGKPLEVDG